MSKGIFTKMRTYGPTPTKFDHNTLMAALCRQSSLEQARIIFKDLVSGNCQPDVISYNIMIESTIKAGDVEFSKELLVDMQQRGLKPDAWTFSILINRFSKLGMMEEAKSIYDRMKACGFLPDVFIFDSLLTGFNAVGKNVEVLALLHQIADSGVFLDDELTSTILMCIWGIPEAENIVKLLPSFNHNVSNSKSTSLMISFQPNSTIVSTSFIRQPIDQCPCGNIDTLPLIFWFRLNEHAPWFFVDRKDVSTSELPTADPFPDFVTRLSHN